MAGGLAIFYILERSDPVLAQLCVIGYTICLLMVFLVFQPHFTAKKYPNTHYKIKNLANLKKYSSVLYKTDFKLIDKDWFS